ncbi:MAG TPA: class I SAM-dependent methyltransferase [Thermoanaerobaculia bacterium]|nr:class I SAM-dependent methyltransferase [Thermoanaerobaculia bacterium]
MTRSASEPESTRRFSNRVENYVRFRPGYPAALLDILENEIGLTAGFAVADIGSGTGISAELFLGRGCTVFGVEPNRGMRQAAEERLGSHERFHSIDGTAEDTTLPARSIDLVVAAQAFHWFDRDALRIELARIAREDATMLLLWNSRRTDSSPFLEEYEAMLHEYGTDYEAVNHRNLDPESLRTMFAGGAMQRRSLYNEQRMDLEGVRGRLLSSSYVPAEGEVGHEPMLAALTRIFDRHQVNGRVTFEYDTEMYFGRIRR